MITLLARSSLAVLILLITCLTPPPTSRAQGQNPCGVVDAIDYPVDGVSIESDDFGMYRAVFGGRHSGIDIAFDRYGDPVRAAARGRITYADPAGWNAEKGVVIVYEVRTMDGTNGGPGYWNVDPLDGGWLHPIDFTEQWRLRLSPAFRKMLTAGGGPVAPPLWHNDGMVTFAEEYHLEQRSKDSQTLWRLDVDGLTGIVNLPDGRILGSTSDDQIMIVDPATARFSASWKADRGLRSPPLRLGDSLIFLTEDNRAVSYDVDGHVRWQTDPLGDHIERYAQSGDRLAISAGQDDTFKLWVIDPSGAVIYQSNAAAPIVPVAYGQNGFIVMTGNQIAIINADLTLKPLMSIGQALGRNSQIALDSQGNAVVYPGRGQQIYSYSADGGLRWQASLPQLQPQPPLIGVGAGCLVYVLSSDGGLLVYRAADGGLRGLAALYAGGIHGHAASRFLKVSPDDQVQFSAGYLSIATIDGPTLADDCKPTTAQSPPASAQ